MSNQRTLEQERAKIAWDCIQKIKNEIFAKDNKKQEGYSTLARKAPADIQTNGLGQTIAFWLAKGSDKGRPDPKSPEYLILQHLSEWLKNQKGMNLQENNLVEWVAKKADVNSYRRATTEAIAFLVWLKRFAESELS